GSERAYCNGVSHDAPPGDQGPRTPPTWRCLTPGQPPQLHGRLPICLPQRRESCQLKTALGSSSPVSTPQAAPQGSFPLRALRLRGELSSKPVHHAFDAVLDESDVPVNDEPSVRHETRIRFNREDAKNAKGNASLTMTPAGGARNEK